MKNTYAVERIRDVVNNGRKERILNFSEIEQRLVDDMESRIDNEGINTFYGESGVIFRYKLKDIAEGIITFYGFTKYLRAAEGIIRKCSDNLFDEACYNATNKEKEAFKKVDTLYKEALYNDGFELCYHDRLYVYIVVNLDREFTNQESGIYRIYNKIKDCEKLFEQKIDKIKNVLLGKFLGYVEREGRNFSKKFEEICKSETIGVEYELDFLEDLDYSRIKIYRVYDMEVLEAYKNTTILCRSVHDCVNSDEDIPYRKRLKLLNEYLTDSGIDGCYLVDEDKILLTLNV